MSKIPEKDITLYHSILAKELLQYTAVPEQDLQAFVSCFEFHEYKKKDIIIAPGNTDAFKIFFILKGITRIYYVLEDKEITVSFKMENNVVYNGFTIFSGVPNIDNHEALEDLQVLAANIDNLEPLLYKSHPLEHLARKIVEKNYSSFIRSNYNRMFLPAEERYDYFMREMSSIVNRIPLKYVASYLGITPETLSRLRAKH
ncbi:MAG TPA: Crp/Fnr family transcriptional regulator [Chitinophagales bacterium]|nr:Crp/Fnr family transcriptional regulator [Chitinophagales bacterium]